MTGLPIPPAGAQARGRALGTAQRGDEPGRSMSIRVLIADDHALIRDALVDLFSATDDIEVVGECSDGSQVLEAVGRTRPDVVLMDLKMPRVDGIEATRQVLGAHPEVRVVILTGALTPATARAAHALGAAGYLLKEGDPGEFPEHLRVVAAGGSAWSPAALAVVDQGWGTEAHPPDDRAASPYVEESPARFRC
jgi:DNA-binding NarL/FixJ family response regulator